MSNIAELKKKWLKDPKVSDAFEEMKPEFEVAHALIAARVEAGLTQEEVAKRMGTTQSVVARLEGGRTLPSIKSLYRYAEATGTKPVIHLVHD
ncbi:MAG: helix-turn-helix transcriptional regulator [Candidatus Sedimenticola endophacoides]